MIHGKQEMWWSEITGPRTFAERIASELIDGRSAALGGSAALPWGSALRDAVSGMLWGYGRDFMLEYQLGHSDDPGETLLKTYAAPDLLNGYRPASGRKPKDYMREKGVLRDRIIWVKPDGNERPWLEFARNWNAGSLSDGLFVVECRGPAISGRNLAAIDYTAYASHYDLLLFTGMLAAEFKNYAAEEKRYAAELAAALSGLDAGLASDLLENCDLLSAEPAEALAGLTAASDEAEIKHNVWKAQIQIFFPLLEMERRGFIEKYRGILAQALECYRSEEKISLQQFGAVVNEPDEMELGSIYYLISRRKLSSPAEYLCYIPDETDRDWLGLLHGMRNTLAHNRPCPVSSIKKFLKRSLA